MQPSRQPRIQQWIPRLWIKMGSVLGALILVGLLLVLSIHPVRSQIGSTTDQPYFLATAGRGGTYFPVGNALASLITSKSDPDLNIRMRAVATAGSRENLELLRNDQAQLAIVLSLWGLYSLEGEGQLVKIDPQPTLRSICALWPNVEHFVIRKSDVQTGTIADLLNLKGKRFAVGAEKSGTEGSNRQILAGLGIDPLEERFEVVYLDYADSVTAFQQGEINIVNLSAGPPVSAMTQLATASNGSIQILSFTDEQVDQVNRAYADLWTPFQLEVGTYPHQDVAVQTISQPNFLAVNANVDPEVVYQITKTLFENLSFLQNAVVIHQASRLISLDNALNGLQVPLHPGAIRYYEEVGISVPETLRS